MALWNKVDNEAGKPKYLSDTLVNSQTVSDKDATLGVDVSEATTAANIAKGIKTAGWTQYRTYTDAQGITRHKSEVLVAFGGNFTGGDNDTIDPDPVITITPNHRLTALQVQILVSLQSWHLLHVELCFPINGKFLLILVQTGQLSLVLH